MSDKINRISVFFILFFISVLVNYLVTSQMYVGTPCGQDPGFESTAITAVGHECILAKRKKR